MLLTKAIEILTYSSEHNTILITGDDKDALKLGIEALKRCQLARKETSFVGPGLLPGETPPGDSP